VPEVPPPKEPAGADGGPPFSDQGEHTEQERAEIAAAAARLMEEGRTLRARAAELIKQADALLAEFLRNHPEK
jgi:hypothetical protein